MSAERASVRIVSVRLVRTIHCELACVCFG